MRRVLLLPFVPLVSVAFALTVSSCGDGSRDAGSVVAPASPQATLAPAVNDAVAARSGFYPLSPGNRWEYTRTLEISDPGDPGDPMTETGTVQRELTGTETVFGREYVVQEDRSSEFGDTILRVRQDASGLYEADLPLATLPGEMPLFTRARAEVGSSSPAVAAALDALLERAALVLRTGGAGPGIQALARHGGPEADELIRLSYPLRPGQAWTVREVPSFTSEVEGRDVLDLPAGRFPAWRVRIDNEFLGPNDRVLFWFARCGELAYSVYLEQVITDINGNVVGTLILRDEQELTAIDLPDRPSCGR